MTLFKRSVLCVPVIFLWAVFCSSFASASGVSSIEDDARKVADRLFTAINNRDAEAFGAVLTRERDPVFFFFWGESVSGRDVLVQWHKEWFAEKGWSIPKPRLVFSAHSPDQVVLSYHVLYKKSADREFSMISTMLLQKEQGDYRVAAIQQTLLQSPESD